MTNKELFQLASDQSGKAIRDLDDDDLLAALGTDNAISRSKDGDPEEQDNLKKSVLSAQRNYGIMSNGEDEELDRLLMVIRRRAGLA